MIDVKSCKKIMLRGQEVKKITDSLGRVLYEVSGPGPTPGNKVIFTGGTPNLSEVSLAVDNYVTFNKNNHLTHQCQFKIVKGAGYDAADIDWSSSYIALSLFGEGTIVDYTEPTFDEFITSDTFFTNCPWSNTKITDRCGLLFFLYDSNYEALSLDYEITIDSANQITIVVKKMNDDSIIMTATLKDVEYEIAADTNYEYVDLLTTAQTFSIAGPTDSTIKASIKHASAEALANQRITVKSTFTRTANSGYSSTQAPYWCWINSSTGAIYNKTTLSTNGERQNGSNYGKNVALGINNRWKKGSSYINDPQVEWDNTNKRFVIKDGDGVEAGYYTFTFLQLYICDK